MARAIAEEQAKFELPSRASRLRDEEGVDEGAATFREPIDWRPDNLGDDDTRVATRKELMLSNVVVPIESDGRHLGTRGRRPSTSSLALGIAILVGVASTLVPSLVLNSSAGASKAGTPECSPASLTEKVSTGRPSYGPAAKVSFIASIRNKSKAACSVAIGPTSPTISLTSSKGVQVWNNCFLDDHSGACAQYLLLHTLAPGASYKRTYTWDQRSGTPPVRVARGVYTLTMRFAGVVGNVRAELKLTARVIPA
jgi:hypothetical protein